MESTAFDEAGHRGEGQARRDAAWARSTERRATSTWEWTLALLLTGAVAALHAGRLLHAGGLWRDEAGAARLATLPALAEIPGLFQHEAFPLLFPLTLRTYALLIGASDFALRWFGLSVGLGIVCILWRNARSTGTLPLLSLALLGFDLPFLIYGDSVRGYGLGSALLLLTYGFLGQALSAPRERQAGALVRVAVAATASVQVLLGSSALLFALCAAAMGVALWRRRGFLAAGIAASGALAATSLLPYAPSLATARRQWSFIVVYPIGFGRLYHALANTLGPSRVIWLLLFGLGLWRFFRRRAWRDLEPGSRDTALFAAWVIPAALVSYGLFLWRLGYPPRAWYFLPLMALLASALEVVFGALSGDRGFRRLRLAAIALLLLTQLRPVALYADSRQTNIDRVARQVASAAASGDLIVVDPWYYGVSFSRYYQGKARWVTLPDLPDHRVHRYDLLKPRLASEHPIDDVLAAVAETLRAHHRVWWVGGEGWPRPGEAVPSLPPAPGTPEGWHDWPYTYAWSRQLGAFLERHAAQTAEVAVPEDGPVNAFEDLTLSVAQGWRQAGGPGPYLMK
ncbi:MAG TPA: hypothetical protein VMM92_05330 [Thermoanaerobaculia bacterium]|nr:hypothetical protein [Thermoanaerobaculia bacterium]